MPAIIIPQSVLDYMTNDGIRSAVDHLLASRPSDFPDEIGSWSEARNYHQALLAAYQVRQEHIMFLIDLWDAIWGSALRETGASLQVVPFLEQHRTFEAPSPSYFWTECWGHGRLIKDEPNGSPIAELAVDYRPEGIKLYVQTYETARPEVTLPAPWSEELDDDGCLFTLPNVAVPTTQSLDGLLNTLIAAAKMAISELDN